MVEAILWDNDGVLVDTEKLFFQSTRDTLASVGVELTFEQFLDLSMRQGRSTFDLLAGCGLPSDRIVALRRERDIVYARTLHNQTPILTAIPHTPRPLHAPDR